MSAATLSRAARYVALCATLYADEGLPQTPGAPPNLAKVTKETEGTCRVSGLVVKKADGAPLKNALVQLENNEDLDHTIVARTTADEHFELRNLPAGKYKLSISRNGYVEAEYGQRKPSDPGVGNYPERLSRI
jgi:hypothetical protein